SAADVAIRDREIDRNICLKELGWKLLCLTNILLENQVHDEMILEGPRSRAEAAVAIVVECMSKPSTHKLSQGRSCCGCKVCPELVCSQ
ncbi:unnamed protein product, partial [Musa acuminata subsp. malaccensis]